MNYTRDDLFSVAKRYNNSKRNYLIVNKKQSKYLPTKPSDTWEMVSALVKKAEGVDTDKQTLVIGFAETATALGHLFTDHFRKAYYLTTTRENLGNSKCIEFREEHSHVVEQRLYYGELENAIKNAGDFSQVIFVDDEFTTGNTLRNLVTELLKAVPALTKCSKFAVTAVDRISSENRLKLEEMGIKVYSLLAFSDDNFSEQVKHIRVFEPLDTCLRKSETISDFIKQQKVKQGNNARLGFWCSFGIEERALAQSLYEQYKEEIKNVDKVLVLGTEEFMSVPIYFAQEIESHQKEVVCHSTARSPIGVNNTLAKYPITKGYKLPSFYDVERLSYLYHMEHYDLIFILTDSKSIPKETIKAMSYLMSIYKNYNTQLIQFK